MCWVNVTLIGMLGHCVSDRYVRGIGNLGHYF